jgi:hypothetical protein
VMASKSASVAIRAGASISVSPTARITRSSSKKAVSYARAPRRPGDGSPRAR